MGLDLHRCRTSDGTTVMCACATGRDHDENEMDAPDVANV